jgi:hypothetical protein
MSLTHLDDEVLRFISNMLPTEDAARLGANSHMRILTNAHVYAAMAKLAGAGAQACPDGEIEAPR